MTLIKTDHIFMKRDFVTQDEIMTFLAAQAVTLGISSDQAAVYRKIANKRRGEYNGDDGWICYPSCERSQYRRSQCHHRPIK